MDFRGFTTKKRIQRLVFPSGIGYDTQNDAVRTLKTNLLFSLISIAQRELLKTKNGKSIQMNQFSVRVTQRGLAVLILKSSALKIAQTKKRSSKLGVFFNCTIYS